MGLHLVVVAAVLHFSRGGAAATTTHIVSNLVWPYLLRVGLSFRIAREDVISSSRLFVFQLTQILMVFDDHNHDDDGGNDHREIQRNRTAHNANNRWRRAFRLIREKIDEIRRVMMGPLPHQQDEDSLHFLSMLAL